VLVVLQLLEEVLVPCLSIVQVLVFVLVEVQSLRVFWIWRGIFLVLVGSCQSRVVVQSFGMLVN
jgi:hypothetical protein